MQRKSAVPTVIVPVLSYVRQLGRGSNTLCVGAFALGLVNLAGPGLQPPAPPQPAIQPPALQATAQGAPAAPASQPAPQAPAAAPALRSVIPAIAETPRPPVETPAPAANPNPSPAPPPTPAPQAAPAVLQKPAPAPAPVPNPNDEEERLRKAADLMVQVNTALGVPQSPYGQIIYDIAIRHSINPHLVAALIHVESAFNAKAVSRKGARGLMQLLPETARRFGLTRKKDLFDPKKNLEAGVRYLKWLTDRFGGDAAKILAAYNAGEGAVDRFGGIPPYQETQSYVQKIFGLLGLSSPAPKPQQAAVGSAGNPQQDALGK